jgi:hypothetical protein
MISLPTNIYLADTRTLVPVMIATGLVADTHTDALVNLPPGRL